MNQQLTGRPESVKRTLIITLQVEETTRNQFMCYQSHNYYMLNIIKINLTDQ